jgi:diadenosine tetraphosphate (Ap4A) HIT family hydrolase
MTSEITGSISAAVECIACSIQRGEVGSFEGIVTQSDHFSLEQDLEVPIPGFLVLVSRRHFYCIDELTEAEQADCMAMLIKARKALREVLGVRHIHLVLEENTKNSHFHLWLVPRYEWVDEKFGNRIDSVKPAMDYAKAEFSDGVSKQNLHKSVEALRSYFL